MPTGIYPRKGHTEETKQKIAIGNTGKVFSEERKAAIAKANRKKLLPNIVDSARKILSEKCCSFHSAMLHIGIKPTRAVKDALLTEGIEICKELQFFSRCIDYPTSKKLLSYLKLNIHWSDIQERTGLTQKEITGARFKLEKVHNFTYNPVRKKPGGYKPTKIELQVSNLLEDMNIEYEKEFSHGNFFYDFRVKNTSLLLEVNGDYWHANPAVYPDKNLLNDSQKSNIRRDHYKRKFAKEHGYYVLYLWEYDLKNNPAAVRITLERYIKNAFEKANTFELLQ